jgi:ABC-type sugar transport system permease subunit
MLSPVIIVAITLKSIDTFKTFDYVWVMTRGGPGGSSHIASTYIYETAFGNLKYGYGASMAFLVALISVLMSLVFIIVLRKTEESSEQ